MREKIQQDALGKVHRVKEIRREKDCLKITDNSIMWGEGRVCEVSLEQRGGSSYGKGMRSCGPTTSQILGPLGFGLLPLWSSLRRTGRGVGADEPKPILPIAQSPFSAFFPVVRPSHHSQLVSIIPLPPSKFYFPIHEIIFDYKLMYLTGLAGLNQVV